ncbi:hypothetical protein TrST_g1879 [Triparma strigata]|uniref:Thioesterase domain-containing protein n=1 Tax=Triparma strigata TaxID=1606541 RepID=A0A9W7BLK6_9STRA|nr:hypothetical protein TrST_g1879 [Triparma strigata]
MIPRQRILKTGYALGHRLPMREFTNHNPPSASGINNKDKDQRNQVGGLDEKDFRLLVEKAAPWSELQGYRMEEASKGYLKVRLPFTKNWIGNVSIPAMHGGVVASLIDHVGGFCAWTVLNKPSDRVSTADLSISYLAPAPASDLIGEGRVYHESNKLVRVDIVVYCAEDENQVSIAAGRGCFYRRNGGGGGEKRGASAEARAAKAAKEAKEQELFFQYLRSKGQGC